MQTLLEKLAATGAAYREALAEFAAAAPELLKDRQEGPENLQAILAQLSARIEWVDRRMASTINPAPAATPAGVARRRAALEKAVADGDQAAVDALTAQLAALGASV